MRSKKKMCLIAIILINKIKNQMKKISNINQFKMFIIKAQMIKMNLLKKTNLKLNKGI